MSGLVTELQRNIISEDVPVSTILRQMKLAAAKLRTGVVEEWVDNELDGYGKKSVPPYRNLRGVLRAWNPYNGWIPVQFDRPEIFEALSKRAVGSSITEIEKFAASKSGTVQLTFNPEVWRRLQAKVSLDFEVALHINSSAFGNIVSAVRNKALEWVIALEQSGVQGSDFTFSKKEREAAKSMTINNTFGNFSGVFGDNAEGNIVNTNWNAVKLHQAIEEARKYDEQLKEAGVDVKGLHSKLNKLETAAADERKSSLVAGLIEGVKAKLAEATGGAVAVGLIAMFNHLT